MYMLTNHIYFMLCSSNRWMDGWSKRRRCFCFCHTSKVDTLSHIMESHSPHIYVNLRTALAALYSLPSEYHRPEISTAQANDFLIQFQSRNVRRKLESVVKRGEEITLEEADRGSTWICCLAMLAAVSSSGQTIHPTEALFVAQTLVHRLRRVKTLEAFDVELEPPGMLSNLRIPDLLHYYKNWVQHWQQSSPTSILGVIFQQYDYTGADEERLKSELTVLTLAALIMDISLAHPHLRPLVSTLSSALAVAVARMRYTPQSIPLPAPDTEPIVTTILSTFGRIRHIIPNSPNVDETYRWVVLTCLTVLPDALLAGAVSGGGAYGSISMDPRCYKAVTMEVRDHGMTQVCQVLKDASDPNLLFTLCQQWAKYAPLPEEMLRATVPMMLQAFSNPSEDELVQSAMGFWITIMESGSWNVEQVLASALLQKPCQQQNKKKQSNKAKKRQQEALEERTTEDHLAVAKTEVRHRQDVALRVALETIGAIRQLVKHELAELHDDGDDVSGEGPVGGIVACANSCLPYLVCTNSHLELFTAISTSIQDLCQSRSRMVRNFGMETLYSLHEAVMAAFDDHAKLGNDLANALVEHFFQCSLSLSLGCAYPVDYFTEFTMSQTNDDELESERNDVRDVLRTVSAATSNAQQANDLALGVLCRLVQRCADRMSSSSSNRAGSFTSLDETSLHTFSALARPLVAVASMSHHDPSKCEDVLKISLSILQVVGKQLTEAIPRITVVESLPLARLYNLAISSFAPMLANLIGTRLQNDVVAAVGAGVETAVVSLTYIPELVARSSFRSSRHDIRGAMRTPGGEDHAGVLALMRLVTQTNDLALAVVQSKDQVGPELCQIYKYLKNIEQERKQGDYFGKGVLPKSRRILLGTICHLEQSTNGAAGASSGLVEVFELSIAAIASIGQQVNNESFFHVTEHTLDLAGFSPAIVCHFFEMLRSAPSPSSSACIEVWTNLVRFGYTHMTDSSIPSTVFVDWNRLRAAVFCLIKASGGPDIPTAILEAMIGWIRAECDAVIEQCHMGPTSSSLIFREEIISEEVVPAGLFLHVVHHFLEVNKTRPLQEMSNCIQILCQCQTHVMEAISCACPCPIQKGSFYDPRPMIAEAWLLITSGLMNRLTLPPDVTGDAIESSIQRNGAELTHAIQHLAIETFATQVQLFLYPTLGKTQESRSHDPGPTTDSAHSLVALEQFMVAFLNLGPQMLQTASMRISEKTSIDYASLQPYTSGESPQAAVAGIAIFGAALLRTCSGGLPPWAVECMPAIYSTLFNVSFGGNIERLMLSLQMAMHVRWVPPGAPSPHERQGSALLLAGRFFHTMSDKHKTTFLEQVLELAQTNTPAGWKRMKAVVKTACGGKKKDTDFNQRPALTKLDDLDRI